MAVRTRFAPSPTGLLHVGAVRTALFSWLYARHHQGEFILRIEDTDEARSTEASVQSILQGLAWLGLDYDEGPFYQSQRYERYLAVIQQLLDEGHAYRCTCSKERLDALRAQQMQNKEKPRYDGHCRERQHGLDAGSYVVRFKNPKTGVVAFEDKVYGLIETQNQELDDLILLRSDGNPTYNFVVVVDDWDMRITHVIRGDDHINNTPRQVNLLHALGAPVPIYAHLPMILGEDGKKLSKRHGAVDVIEFKKQGILPDALLNYLVRLGWSHGDEEIFSRSKMIEVFDLNHVHRGSSGFSYDKLYWLNQQYLKTEPVAKTATALAWHFANEHIDVSNGPSLHDLLSVQAERFKTLAELCEQSRFFYDDDLKFDATAIKKHWTLAVLEPLTMLLAHFKNVDVWQKEVLHQNIADVCAHFDLSMGKIGPALRIAITGGLVSPSIDATLVLLGRDKVLRRLAQAISQIQHMVA